MLGSSVQLHHLGQIELDPPMYWQLNCLSHRSKPPKLCTRITFTVYLAWLAKPDSKTYEKSFEKPMSFGWEHYVTTVGLDDCQTPHTGRFMTLPDRNLPNMSTTFPENKFTDLTFILSSHHKFYHPAVLHLCIEISCGYRITYLEALEMTWHSTNRHFYHLTDNMV